MPPQQPDRLLDLFDQLLDFRAHRLRPFGRRRLGADPRRRM
jgi:hypothetical protein